MCLGNIDQHSGIPLRGREDEERLFVDMIKLTHQFDRYGYRRVKASLRDAGWQVNDKLVERLWEREGLKVSMKRSKRGRLWLDPSRDIAAQCPVGQWMAPVFGSSPNIKTTSGPVILFITVPTMAEFLGSRTSLMSLAVNVWLSA